MKPIQKLSNKHLSMIEWLICHPAAFQSDLAKEFNLNQASASAIYRSPCFQEELDKRLKEQWAEARKIAQDTMIGLATNGDRQAAAYILDSNGYGAKQEIELNNKLIKVSIDD